MGTKHGQLMRGLDAAGHSDTTLSSPFGARFGRFLPRDTSGKFSQAALRKLADAMTSDFDAPKDAPDGEESGIPALYTYLGQFIDHDLTFDPTASFQKQKDPTATEDFRTPAFDLDNVYGRGPGDQPYLYQPDGLSFQFGDPITMAGSDTGARDLQRNANGRALIGDPRNDENSIVSQLQGLFLRYHNKLVHDARRPVFDTIQAEVRRTYQYLVINDFLPRIVSDRVLRRYRNAQGLYDASRLRFSLAELDVPFMPVEFSVGAYRLGHSMVRPGYRLNDSVLVPIFPVPASVAPGFPDGLTGFRRLTSDWAIDWGRFIDVDVRDYGSEADFNKAPKQPTEANFRRLQFAYRIDTALVKPLLNLPPSVASHPASLAERNLKRGAEFGLPSGQAMAEQLGFKPLDDADILIGQGVDHPSGGSLRKIRSIDPSFKNHCPLWTYILAEAMHHKTRVKLPVTQNKSVSTPQLGPVGGTLVAETFLGLMFRDGASYLHHQHWAPHGNHHYRLKDLVRSALTFKP